MTVLQLRDVSRVHGSGPSEVRALDGVSLTVQAASWLRSWVRVVPASRPC
jgi:hypothetical protein